MDKDKKSVIDAAVTIKEWCDDHNKNCVECPFDEGVSCTFLHGLPHKWEIKNSSKVSK